jgi:uncharacterized protein (DUF1697 family)
METYIALLRGINVNGDTSLPMPELTSICNTIGFKQARTYIRSGNVIFGSEVSEAMAAAMLEQALYAKKQKHIPVIIRTAKELEAVIACNPFPNAKPEQVGVMFFVDPVPEDILNGITIRGPEEVVISGRELYIHYPNGIGRSTLKLPPVQQPGTVRNINTVTQLARLGGETVN